jgi:hypothetical protein
LSILVITFSSVDCGEGSGAVGRGRKVRVNEFAFLGMALEESIRGNSAGAAAACAILCE